MLQNLQADRSNDMSYILAKPNPSTNELGSIKVDISCLDDFPEFKKIYNQHKKQEVMMCVGGPAAEDQAVIASLIPEIFNKIDKIIYVTRNYNESNVAHSAKQYHIRHANALNADPHLTGRNIIKAVLRRALFGMKPREIVDSGFLKIDVAPTLNFKTLGIYLGNEFNSIKQSFRSLCGQLTEHEINRISAFLGGEFFAIIEEKLGVKISGKKDNANLDHPSAIHVTFNEAEAKAAEVENKLLEKINIHSQELTREQIDDFFGESNRIYKAYAYPSDTHVVFDIHAVNKKFAMSRGVEWSDHSEIKKILVTKDVDGAPKVAGVIDDSGNFTYVSKLHFTGGYKVEYVYDKNSKARFRSGFFRKIFNKIEDKFNLQKPLNNEVTIATGVSINALFKKTKNFGEISVTNSHWTKIAEDETHMIVRITGGGNTGSEKYNPAYALNVAANSRRIFGDALVGIISAYGCSRAVNGKNSTEWAQLAKGLVVSYGKGGTGNTKRHFEALKALYKLEFDKEVRDFCNQYKSARRGFLGDRIDEMMKFSTKDFFSNNCDKTARRLGFTNKIILKELVLIIFNSVIFILYQPFKFFKKSKNI